LKKAQQLQAKGILLGILLLGIAVASSLVVYKLRNQQMETTAEQMETTAEQMETTAEQMETTAEQTETP